MAARAHRMKRAGIILVLLVIACGVVVYRWRALQIEKLPAFPWGELRIGVDASLPPFAAVNDGSLYGLDIDLGHALGTELDVPVRFVNIGIDGLYDALRSDQVDILISALRVEAWRLGDVRYTQPYFNAGLMLVSPVEAPIDAMQVVSGHALAYEFGSDADAAARRWSRRIASFETQPYELSAYALDAVRLDMADAALVDAVSYHLYLQDHPGWQVHTHYVHDAGLVIAVRLHRGETLKAVDTALSELLRKGIVDAIIDRWL